MNNILYKLFTSSFFNYIIYDFRTLMCIEDSIFSSTQIATAEQIKKILSNTLNNIKFSCVVDVDEILQLKTI
jgi:hypothetical protein